MMGAALDAAAARRLREALDVLASGDLPECPVCFDVPKAAHARILRCCAKIMCKTCIPSCNGLCPFCRAPFAVDPQWSDASREAEDGESPYTYNTKDYSLHQDFHTTNEYTSSSYAASNDYSVHKAYAATNDYSAASSSSYTSSTNYTVSTDYSSIAAKYCASSGEAEKP